MSELSELAAKYVRQLDSVNDLQRTMHIARTNMEREQADLGAMSKLLKDRVDRNNPTPLVPIGSGRHVLIRANVGLGVDWAQIWILEETK